jgi:hypothetical protein
MEHLNNYKYSNKLFCHDCGSVFIRNGGSNRFNNPIWTCKTYRTKGLGKCASPNIKESFLDKIFIEVFIEFLKNKKDYKLKIFNEYKNIIMNNNNNLDITNLNNKIKSIKMYKDKLLDLSLKGIINDLEFKSRNDKFNLELKDLQKSLDNSSNDILENNELDKLESWINNNLEVENNLPYLINLLVDKVIVIKVDNNRKNINLKISFTFNAPSIEYNLNFVNKCSCINRL